MMGRVILFNYLIDKFDLDFSTGCWEWNRGLHSTGYGACYHKLSSANTSHRLSYEVFKGPISPGLMVLHSCDNRRCCNPDHLRTGTQKDNMQDRKERGSYNVGHTWNQGSKHSKAKLTEKDIPKIRQLLSEGRLTHKQIASMFGVTSMTIGDIKHKRSWKHI
jgi:hypothetical protein